MYFDLQVALTACTCVTHMADSKLEKRDVALNWLEVLVVTVLPIRTAEKPEAKP